MQPPAHYEPYLDGLFTYCLSVLCEHDAAASALGDVLALAERQRARLRNAELRRPWLYALARWVCLRRLAQSGPPSAPRASEAVATERHRELAALAWPEAAGTTPEQREALELAVRHRLRPHEVAHILGLGPDDAHELLARAACEVERTRAALAVVDAGSCPAAARLAGDDQVRLGTALRRELVRHVDECPACRRTAERAEANGPWPGVATPATPAVLAVATAPRSAAYAALMEAMRTGAGRSREGTPAFDRRGFPMDFKDRAARRALIRHRAVTTTVVAAVVAAPVLALWTAYRGSPSPGLDEPDGLGVSAGEDDGLDSYRYGKAAGADAADPKRTQGGLTPAGPPGSRGPAATVDTTPSPRPTPTPSEATTAPGPPRPGRGYLTVEAQPSGGDTVITLRASGGSKVRWSASATAYWLRLSARSGELAPGETTVITVTVDRAQEPQGAWEARIAMAPSGTYVTVHGQGTTPSPPPPPDPTPTTTSPPTEEPPPAATDSAPPLPPES